MKKLNFPLMFKYRIFKTWVRLGISHQQYEGEDFLLHFWRVESPYVFECEDSYYLRLPESRICMLSIHTTAFNTYDEMFDSYFELKCPYFMFVKGSNDFEAECPTMNVPTEVMPDIVRAVLYYNKTLSGIKTNLGMKDCFTKDVKL